MSVTDMAWDIAGVAAWLGAAARPLPDLTGDTPRADLTGDTARADLTGDTARADLTSLLAALADGTAVVGLAHTVRTAHEPSETAYRLTRAIISRAGFRAVHLEGTTGTAADLHAYVSGGPGDPGALLRASLGFLRTQESLNFMTWLRGWNSQHPSGQVSLVHGLPVPESTSLTAIEDHLATADLDWRERTGDRIVHIGGTAHLVAAGPRTLSPLGQTQISAGTRLRGVLGRGYRAVALTAGTGHALMPLPAPPPEFHEAVFDLLEGTDTSAAVWADL
jgi:erythromycin esterase